MDHNPLEQEIARLFAATFGLAESALDIDTPLVELGADSLLLFDLADVLAQRYAIRLTVRQFFADITTVRQVANCIAQQRLTTAKVNKAPQGLAPNSALPAQASLLPEQSAGNGGPVARDAQPADTEARRRYLQEFIPRYNAKTRASKQHAEAVRRVIADSRSAIGFSGAEVRDIDGNNYIDMTMGFGAHLFGHCPDFIQHALETSLAKSFGLGVRHEQALAVANLVTEITGMQRVAFVNSGTEAVMNAVRVARAYTRRDRVVMFTTSYHGHWDGVLATPGQRLDAGATQPLSVGTPTNMVADVTVLEFGSPAALTFIEQHASEIAAVLIEPVPTRDPTLASADHLRQLRAITAHQGILLIFDEIVTGFRVHPAGVQGLYGIEADLVTYGKTLGGGMPLGVIAGRGNILDAIDGGGWSYGDNSYPATETTFFGGTYFQHPLSLAAAHATLMEIKRRGMSLSRELSQKTDALVLRLNQLFRDRRLPIVACAFGSFFRLMHRENFDLLYYNLLLRGVYIWEWRCWFLSTAHNQTHLDLVYNAFTDSLDHLQNNQLLP